MNSSFASVRRNGAARYRDAELDLLVAAEIDAVLPPIAPPAPEAMHAAPLDAGYEAALTAAETDLIDMLRLWLARRPNREALLARLCGAAPASEQEPPPSEPPPAAEGGDHVVS